MIVKNSTPLAVWGKGSVGEGVQVYLNILNSFTVSLWKHPAKVVRCHHSHFADEKTEAQRG